METPQMGVIFYVIVFITMLSLASDYLPTWAVWAMGLTFAYAIAPKKGNTDERDQ